MEDSESQELGEQVAGPEVVGGPWREWPLGRDVVGRSRTFQVKGEGGTALPRAQQQEGAGSQEGWTGSREVVGGRGGRGGAA